MPEIIVRPSTKLIRLTYWLALLAAAAIFAASRVENAPRFLIWALVLPALAMVWAAAKHIVRSFTKLMVAGERLRYETGVFGRTTRTMELAKVQDVRVDQTLGQRLLRLGDLSIETAGETSRITIAGIDRPNEVADEILAAVRHNPKV